MSTQEVSLETSFSRWKYDVFLSYRYKDTVNFINHLHANFKQRGIRVFRYDKEYKKQGTVSPELFQAIEKSRISIIVFSRNYASSTPFLDEIVKMIECKNSWGQIVIPIFYDVDPSVVSNLIKVQKWKIALKEMGNLFGWIQEAFFKHEETFRENIRERVQKWKTALNEACSLPGWNLNVTNRLQTEFIQDIVKDIVSRYFEDLVGVDSRLEDLRMLIGSGSSDVCMIGIYGMRGIGKTTIARVVYETISYEYECSIFLGSVGEISNKDGLVSLQKQLLSQIFPEEDIKIRDHDDGIDQIRKLLRHKKILLVIDDVNHIDQLKKLAGNRDWFGSGSRIIITARDKNLLMAYAVDKAYKVEGLNYREALQLFSLKAFRNRHPSEDYMELSKCVVENVGGHPLALNILGFFLCDKTIDEWKHEIENLNRDSGKDSLYKLKINIDRLQDMENEIVQREIEALKEHNRLWEARSSHVLTENLGRRLLSVFFLVLEAISMALDVCGKNKWGFLLAAFLLSALGFITTLYASIKRRTAAAFRLQPERQLAWVEIVFSLVQVVTSLIQFILTVYGVKNNFNNASLLPLAFAVIAVVFAFQEKRVISQDQGSNIQV